MASPAARRTALDYLGMGVTAALIGAAGTLLVVNAAATWDFLSYARVRYFPAARCIGACCTRLQSSLQLLACWSHAPGSQCPSAAFPALLHCTRPHEFALPRTAGMAVQPCPLACVSWKLGRAMMQTETVRRQKAIDSGEPCDIPGGPQQQDQRRA
jgi:hypothetical protein